MSETISGTFRMLLIESVNAFSVTMKYEYDIRILILVFFNTDEKKNILLMQYLI